MNAPSNCSSCISIPKFTLSRKQTSIEVEYLLGIRILGDTQLVDYQSDNQGGHLLRPIAWKSNYGLITCSFKNFKIYGSCRLSASVTTSWKDRFSLRTSDMNFGHNLEAGIIIGEVVVAKGNYEHLLASSIAQE